MSKVRRSKLENAETDRGLVGAQEMWTDRMMPRARVDLLNGVIAGEKRSSWDVCGCALWLPLRQTNQIHRICGDIGVSNVAGDFGNGEPDAPFRSLVPLPNSGIGGVEG